MSIQVENKAKVVKRYANRKLYDTESSSYVTLADLYSFARAGREIRVIDNTSKQDITSKTLLASLVESDSETQTVSLESVLKLIRNVI